MDAKRGRIVALDILRGYFILVIIINHFAWHTNLFEPFTGMGGLWATAAEGFFTVSGILVGYIYGPKMLQSTSYVIKRIWRRAALLYILFVCSTLIFTFLATIAHSPHIPPGLWQGGSLTDLLTSTLTFHYLYGLNDFLSRYAIFMFIAPVVLWMVAKYRGRGVAAVVLASVTLWQLLQPFVYSSPHANILIWQTIFMPSIAIGFYLPTIEQWFVKLTTTSKRVLISIMSIVTLITYSISYIYMSYNSEGLIFWIFTKIPTVTDPIIGFVRAIGDNMGPLVDKQSLGIVLVTTGIFWFWTLYILVRRYEARIDAVTRGLISFIGKHSLTAYVTHAFVIFFVTLIVQNPNSGEVPLKTLMSLAVVVVTISIVWVFSYCKDRLLKKR